MMSRNDLIDCKISADNDQHSSNDEDVVRNNSQLVINPLENPNHFTNEESNWSSSSNTGDSFSGEDVFINPTYPHTDSGNAELVVSMYFNKLKYDHDQQKYFIYNDQYWIMDNKETIIQYGKAAARMRQELSIYIENPNLSDAEFEFGVRSENLSKIRNAFKIARSDDRIAVETSNWSNNEYLVQFSNGLYDIEREVFRSGTPEDMIRQTVGYNYDSGAVCPVWDKALLEMMEGNLDLVQYIQTAVGYSLTEKTTEQCLFFLTGDGANGKSVFLNMLLLLLGGYALNTPFSVLEAKKRSSNSNDLARLVGARLITSSESSESGRLNEERVKGMTGGDSITARFLYKEHVTFIPGFKIWGAVNTLPEIHGTDNGIWRRIRVIPFNASFLGREDQHLGQKLHRELPGIMNWAIEGAHEWKRHGLIEPKIVVDATKTYRADSDIVGSFLDTTVEKNPSDKIQASALFQEFMSYCTNAGLTPGTQTKFGRQMRSLGYKSTKLSGTTWYEGISNRNAKPVDVSVDFGNQI
jgi:putative DNA primase/helicase